MSYKVNDRIDENRLIVHTQPLVAGYSALLVEVESTEFGGQSSFEVYREKNGKIEKYYDEELFDQPVFSYTNLVIKNTALEARDFMYMLQNIGWCVEENKVYEMQFVNAILKLKEQVRQKAGPKYKLSTDWFLEELEHRLSAYNAEQGLSDGDTSSPNNI